MQSKIDPLIIAYNENKSEELKTKILENYQHLAIYIAKKFAYNRSDIEELIQIANIAILKAIERLINRRAAWVFVAHVSLGLACSITDQLRKGPASRKQH